jgi:uncharacterized protein (TIGR00725 family)
MHRERQMNENRRKAIIAVFGGSVDPNAIKKAREIGAVLAERHHILLTGATEAGMDAVSRAAILGAGDGLRIGVNRSGNIDAAAQGSEFVISTDLKHKRNYLEACLCDAAIGLHGEDGTVSEVTFSLAVQRPVVFLGDHWIEEGALAGANRAAVLDLWIERAFRRVGIEPVGRPYLDECVNPIAIRAALAQLPQYTYLASTAAPEDAVDWIEGVLQLIGRGGYFPPIEGYERVAEEYEEWLWEHAV